MFFNKKESRPATATPITLEQAPEEELLKTTRLGDYTEQVTKAMQLGMYKVMLKALENAVAEEGLHFVAGRFATSFGTQLPPAGKHRLGKAMLRAKARHISPNRSWGDIDFAIEKNTSDGDTIAMAEQMLEALSGQDVTLVQMPTPLD